MSAKRIVKSVAIIGAGGLGRLALNILRLNRRKVYGFFDDEIKAGTSIDGVLVKGTSAYLIKDRTRVDIIIGIGDIEARKRIFDLLSAQGLGFTTAVHPTACVASDAVVEQGCIVKENAVLEIGAHIGANSIIGNGTVICHDTHIGRHCRISPGVVIAGHARIGDGCYLAPNVSVDRKITIGRQSVIASGCTIWKNILEHSIVKLPQDMHVSSRSLL